MCQSVSKLVLQLEGNMRATGNVEVWLGDLLTMQQKSLHSIINMASNQTNEEDFNLLGFMYESIAQVLNKSFLFYLKYTTIIIILIFYIQHKL